MFVLIAIGGGALGLIALTVIVRALRKRTTQKYTAGTLATSEPEVGTPTPSVPSELPDAQIENLVANDFQPVDVAVVDPDRPPLGKASEAETTLTAVQAPLNSTDINAAGSSSQEQVTGKADQDAKAFDRNLKLALSADKVGDELSNHSSALGNERHDANGTDVSQNCTRDNPAQTDGISESHTQAPAAPSAATSPILPELGTMSDHANSDSSDAPYATSRASLCAQFTEHPPADLTGESGRSSSETEQSPIVQDRPSEPGGEIIDYPESGCVPDNEPSSTIEEIERFSLEREDVQSDEANAQSEPARNLRQYRPAPRGASRQQLRTTESNRRLVADRALPIHVRLVFEKAGFCRVSLLARRAEGLADDILIRGNGSPGELIALQDDWYQDVPLPSSGDLLRTGVTWQEQSDTGRRVRWSLSGREIFVLASHDDLSGFVSATRLVIGEEHLVLCTSERLSEVQDAIKATGSPRAVELESGSGVPEGWIGLRGVTPRIPVTPSTNGEILDVLRPIAQAEISLTGGIRLERACWLAGHPPRIRLRGDAASAGTLYIDGEPAGLDAAGAYQALRWDSLGDHFVECTSGTKTYRIAQGVDTWEPWEAYTWSGGDLSAGDQRRPSICGGLVLPPRTISPTQSMFQLPVSNPVLLGAKPGEVYACKPRSDIRARALAAFPPFKPVWALPANSLHCDKRASRIVQLMPISPMHVRGGGSHSTDAQALRAWCCAILDAGRKGIPVDSADMEAFALWNAYKRAARTIWRSIK